MLTKHHDPRSGMMRVSPSYPCPVCKKPDWCLVARDGYVAICSRTESSKRCGEAGWLHRLTEPIPTIPPKESKAKPTTNWLEEAKTFASYLGPERQAKLAADLKLPTAALNVLPLVGFSPDGNDGFFTFPEVDETGTVIGLNRRFTDGSKQMMRGGNGGLTLPDGWSRRPGPLLIPEGASDTVALTAAGLCAVGRPSCRGGVPLLAKLLRDWPTVREIFIVGENDKKESGEWPGCKGAEYMARQLATELNRPVRWTLPPNDSRDARYWLTAAERGEMLWSKRGAELLDFLEANVVTFDPPNIRPDAGVREGTPNDSPDNPHRLAHCFRAGMLDPIRFWRGDFLR